MVKLKTGKPTERALAKPAYEMAEGSPGANLAAFVAQAKPIATRKGIDFEEDLWEVSKKLGPRSGPIDTPGRRNLAFATERGRGRVGEALRTCVKEFAKAYIVHFLGIMQITGLTDRLDAMRYLGVALGEGAIETVTISVLDSAMDALKAYYGADSARNRGVQLELIAEFLDESGMVLADLSSWSHGCPSPTPKGGCGEPGSDAGAKRLPTPAFQAAITTSFARAVLPHHVLISGGCTIMRSVPSRVGQILKLTENAASVFEEDGQSRLQLLVPGSKGGPPTVKLVDEAMDPIVCIAFDRMLKASAEPRAMKRHYRDFPSRVYLPGDLEHLRGRDLTRDGACTLLSLDPGYLNEYASKHDLDIPRSAHSNAISFSVIERHILSKLEMFEHDAGGRDYNPLMLIKWRSLTTRGSPCMFQPLTSRTFRMALKPKHGCVGMFPRLGVERPEEATGLPHSFRRDLVTKAIRGGLDQDDLLQWCGAADARWIPFYDYTTDADFRDPASGVAEILLEGIADDVGDGGDYE